MIREAIATGDNVDAAFANACAQLGVDRKSTRLNSSHMA